MINIERNYEILEAKLFAIMKIFCDWRHYLERPYNIVDVVTDYYNWFAFMTINNLIQKY